MSETDAIDHETQVYTKIWDLLLARQKFASLVPVGNRIRYDNVEGLGPVEKENYTDADLYEAILFTQSGEDSMLTEDATFETYSTAGPSQWTERLKFVFVLLLTSPWMSVAKIDRLVAEARTALRRAKTKMGLSFVTDVKVSWKTEREVKANSDGTPEATARWTSAVEISVDCETEGATLLGD